MGAAKWIPRSIHALVASGRSATPILGVWRPTITSTGIEIGLSDPAKSETASVGGTAPRGEITLVSSVSRDRGGSSATRSHPPPQTRPPRSR